MQFYELISRLRKSLAGKITSSTRRVFALSLVGVLVGLVAVAFHYSVDLVRHFLLLPTTTHAPWVFLILSFCCVLGASAGASWLIRSIAPDAGGGGVMPTKLAYWTRNGALPLRTAVVKFTASVLTLGGGVSMGPEGPSVQIGAAAASGFGRRLGVDDRDKRLFCACGAAAALAAVFNAPLAAIVFVLEEIIGDLNSKLISGILFAAVTGALVSHALIGAQPAFQVARLDDPSWKGFLLCLLVSVLATVSGVWFQQGALALRARVKAACTWWPQGMKPMIGALVSWLIAAMVFLYTGQLGVFGVGYSDVTQAIGGSLSWTTALILWGAKLLATIFALGSGGCGGIFAPSFFIGAMCGALVSSLAGHWLALSASDTSILVMAGMCACLGAVIRTPLTCVLLIFEVTHQFATVPMLLLATLISQLLARKLQREGMYDQMLRQDGISPNHILPPRNYKSWREMPVSSLMVQNPICARDTNPQSLGKLFSKYTFRRFPSLDENGRPLCVLRRAKGSDNTSYQLEACVWISADATLDEAQRLFRDADADFLCVKSADGGNPLDGILTLNDFLRAQSRMADDSTN